MLNVMEMWNSWREENFLKSWNEKNKTRKINAEVFTFLYSRDKSPRKLPAVFCEKSEAIWITQGLPGEIFHPYVVLLYFSNISIRETSEKSHSSTRWRANLFAMPILRISWIATIFHSSTNRAILSRNITVIGFDI